MQITFKKRGSTLTARLEGELDQHCASELRSAIDTAVRSEGNIEILLLDLGRVSFMDSSGIGVILGRYKLMRKLGGELAISNAQPQVEKLLKLSGVYALLDAKRREKASE